MATSDEILRELREINRKLDRLLGKDGEPVPVEPRPHLPHLTGGAALRLLGAPLPEPEEVFLTDAMRKRFERTERRRR